MIHKIAQISNRRFFLTRKEQKERQDQQPLSLCPNCLLEDEEYGFLNRCKGYRKHIIFDLLKDKADIFYSKMQERRALEISSTADGK